jgi:hypothetical protein
VKAHDAGTLDGPGTKVITPEQMELSRLRTENKRLTMELEITKKAAPLVVGIPSDISLDIAFSILKTVESERWVHYTQHIIE